MQYPKSLRSKRVRFAMIPAALLCVTLSGCADEQPTGPGLPRLARAADLPYSKFFVAWSRNFSSSPIQTQIFSLDHRQNRQYAEWFVNESVLSFARTHPGRLYIVGDEPDQYCVAPADYAEWYHVFVQTVRREDPTARFSPAGVAEPNERCCPLEDEACMNAKHSIAWMDQFYNAYVQRYGVAPTVSEWRFHNFALPYSQGDMDGWWASVDKQAAWSVAHGANMVLGAWGFMRWREGTAAYLEYMKQAIGRISSDPRINEAVYWSHEPWIHSTHPLVNEDGSLTAEGQTHVNPLTDIPVAVATIPGANGNASLQWTNTTSAWSAEAEFWVQTPGSGSFVHQKTERGGILGARSTSSHVFYTGDLVKGRVRYYNAWGQAQWSAFSDPVLIASGERAKAGSRKAPRHCSLPTGTQSQNCN